MLDIKFIRENPQVVQNAAKNKGVDVDINYLLEIDSKYRELSLAVQKLREERNALTSGIKGKPASEQIEKGKVLKERLEKEEHALNSVQEELNEWLLKIPNIPADDVPIGKDETGNKEIRKIGGIPRFSFKAKSHDELALSLDLYDTKHATKIAGTRGYFLKNELVLLEQGVLQLALEFMIKQGFTPMTVPWIVNKDALWGTGYFPWGIEDHYTTQDGQGLIGTSEVSLTAYHQGEVLNEKDLPIKLVGISPCFRREVGSYGKDTKGFIRVHQFNKVEQVVLSVADEQNSREWHEKMLEYSEKILQDLKLPYRVMLMCTGDMGAGQRKKYDIETWFPSQNKYRETHSASYFNDFQARRLNIRYRTKNGNTKYVYTLNNTVIATPRILAAILENYQEIDGSVIIPKVLRKYFNNFDKISPKKQ
ncbi:MAG: serine--tRNA ligase [Candidatus Levybacteria bacterium]|nr:serine--tRNA ligase [Candidatus Levybacteria bacterium]